MENGDLVKIYPHNGASSAEFGIYWGKGSSGTVFGPLVELFLINGTLHRRSSIVYKFEVINENFQGRVKDSRNS